MEQGSASREGDGKTKRARQREARERSHTSERSGRRTTIPAAVTHTTKPQYGQMCLKQKSPSPLRLVPWDMYSPLTYRDASIRSMSIVLKGGTIHIERARSRLFCCGGLF